MMPVRRYMWLVCALLVVAALAVPRAAVQDTQAAGVDQARLSRIDDVIATAIAEKKLPGAVVLVGRGDSVAFRKAYGNRALAPSVEAMTPDTIFDMASLTKVMATTTAVMMLVIPPKPNARRAQADTPSTAGHAEGAPALAGIGLLCTLS
jgi:CubicO group peptidase (beta-lactamase class C family)